jgi:hypothetical protein
MTTFDYVRTESGTEFRHARLTDPPEESLMHLERDVFFFEIGVDQAAEPLREQYRTELAEANPNLGELKLTSKPANHTTTVMVPKDNIDVIYP